MSVVPIDKHQVVRMQQNEAKLNRLASIRLGIEAGSKSIQENNLIKSATRSKCDCEKTGTCIDFFFVAVRHS